MVGEPAEGGVVRFVEGHGAEDEGAVDRIVHGGEISVVFEAVLGPLVVVDVPAGFGHECPHPVHGGVDGDVAFDAVEFVGHDCLLRWECNSRVALAGP